MTWAKQVGSRIGVRLSGPRSVKIRSTSCCAMFLEIQIMICIHKVHSIIEYSKQKANHIVNYEPFGNDTSDRIRRHGPDGPGE